MLRKQALVAIVVVILFVSACSSDKSKPSAAGASSSASHTPRRSSIRRRTDCPRSTGSLIPLPAGKPGDVIKTEPVASTALHGTMQRVMYHSQSIQGQDIPVTGLIAVPNTPPPPVAIR